MFFSLRPYINHLVLANPILHLPSPGKLMMNSLLQHMYKLQHYKWYNCKLVCKFQPANEHCLSCMITVHFSFNWNVKSIFDNVQKFLLLLSMNTKKFIPVMCRSIMYFFDFIISASLTKIFAIFAYFAIVRVIAKFVLIVVFVLRLTLQLKALPAAACESYMHFKLSHFHITSLFHIVWWCMLIVKNGKRNTHFCPLSTSVQYMGAQWRS